MKSTFLVACLTSTILSQMGHTAEKSDHLSSCLQQIELIANEQKALDKYKYTETQTKIIYNEEYSKLVEKEGWRDYYVADSNATMEDAERQARLSANKICKFHKFDRANGVDILKYKVNEREPNESKYNVIVIDDSKDNLELKYDTIETATSVHQNSIADSLFSKVFNGFYKSLEPRLVHEIYVFTSLDCIKDKPPQDPRPEMKAKLNANLAAFENMGCADVCYKENAWVGIYDGGIGCCPGLKLNPPPKTVTGIAGTCVKFIPNTSNPNPITDPNINTTGSVD